MAHGTRRHRLHLQPVRLREPQVAGPLRRLRRVELAGRGGGRAAAAGGGRRSAARRGRWPRWRSSDSAGIATGLGELDRVLGGGLVPGLARAGRRRAGRRQELAAAAGAASDRGRGRAGAAGLRRGVAGPGAAAGASGWARSTASRILAETELDAVCEAIVADGAGRVRHRLGADPALARPELWAGQRRAGARGGRPARPRGQGPRHNDRAGRPRDQGRRRGRAARPGAPGRCGAPVRGRPLPLPARAARGQEPVRLDQRDRHLRDDRRRPGGGGRSVGRLRRRRRGRPRVGAAGGDRGDAADPARGAGAGGGVRPGNAAAADDRLRSQPALDVAGRARPPCRRPARLAATCS